MRLTELAEKVAGELAGRGDIDIRGVAGIGEAQDGDITFVADVKHLQDLAACRASAVIVPRGAPKPPIPSIAVKNPRYAFAQMLRIFHERPYAPGGVSERAVIGKDAVLGAGPTIHPFAVVSDGAKIGSRVTLYPGVFVGAGSSIGDDTVIYPNVSIREGVTIGSRVIIHSGTVIGSDGFGFVTEGGLHHKILQIGGVIIEDDVEIGANCTIDRAALGMTRIKKGAKLDNMVHVAHNVTIGEHCLLAAQVGIAGSSTLGDYVVFGGQAGLADHTTVGDRAMVGGGSGVTRNMEPGMVVAGFPAIPLREWLKAQVVFAKLPELKKLVAQLIGRIEELEKKA
ncbi:MAG: UDP-3-O-(3-hydroxymyristoyl)glucosamine N-acyltransferase [Nitrospirae bacterium]|nr:UDP-3-O-(3-hydroxymyristoyl)glucosamine N-acyltransferase [Nitrospirota bacterium]